MTWHRVVCAPSAPDQVDGVTAAMFAAGAEGVHEDGATLVTHLPESADIDAFVRALRDADDAATITVAPLEDVDWSLAWRTRISAHRLGALTVAPPWLAEGLPSATTVVIEPAMAFGTGEHPTTRGVVRLLEATIRPGDAVADLGAGSAVLAIAAVKLGAARAFAIENDVDSIANAEENVVRNGVASQVAVLEGDAALLLPLVAPVRVILANIISSVLLDLLPSLPSALAPDGEIILSGILQEERPAMLAALASHGWRVVAEDAEEVWWSVRAVR